MRRWIALLAGITAIAVTGTALALTGAGDDVVEESKETPSYYEAPTIFEIRRDVEKDGPIEEPVEETATDEDGADAKRETTEEPADTTPPALAILHPHEDQVFESKEVVFEGTTEPGARVFAGKYQADVRNDGSWRIVLYLSPGGNLATIRAEDAAGNVSSASISVTYHAPDMTEDKPDEKPEEQPKEGEDQTWEFSANQAFGECSEIPPFDVFHGTGKPGTLIYVKSEFGNGIAEVNQEGQWEIKVYFETAPVGVTFPVRVKDELGNEQIFEFTHTD